MVKERTQSEHLLPQRIVMLVFFALILVSALGLHRSSVASLLRAGNCVPILVQPDQKSSRTPVLAVLNPLKCTWSLVSLPEPFDFPYFINASSAHFEKATLTGIKSLLRAPTNLTFWDKVFLAEAARPVRRFNSGWFKVDKEMAAAFVSTLLASKGEPDWNAVPSSGRRITVNVWNASGKKGMAYNVTRFLRREGYDVLDWGNYKTEEEATRVIDHTGEIITARILADTLGVQNYHSEPTTKAFVDVEVIIGRNYSGPAGMNVQPF